MDFVCRNHASNISKMGEKSAAPAVSVPTAPQTTDSSGAKGVYSRIMYPRRLETKIENSNTDGKALDANPNSRKELLFVTDVRGHEADYTMDKNGFQFVKHIGPLVDFNDIPTVKRDYYPAIEELIRNVTGCSSAHAWSHEVRSSAQMGSMNGPLLRPHIDRTAPCIRRHLHEMFDEETYNQIKDKKLLHISVWRPLRTVYRDPIGVIESNSYNRERDLISFERGPEGPQRLETFLAFSSPEKQHRWMYMNQQRPDEPLLIKFTDERDGQQPTGCPHSGFVMEDTPADAPIRESCEVRVLAAFDA